MVDSYLQIQYHAMKRLSQFLYTIDPATPALEPLACKIHKFIVSEYHYQSTSGSTGFIWAPRLPLHSCFRRSQHYVHILTKLFYVSTLAFCYADGKTTLFNGAQYSIFDNALAGCLAVFNQPLVCDDEAQLLGYDFNSLELTKTSLDALCSEHLHAVDCL